jgi:carbon starvation protein CstA
MRTLVIASFLTLAALLSGATFYVASSLLTALDFLVLAVFLAHALRSRYYWTLCLPAFQLLTCLTHVAKLVAPGIMSQVYSAGQAFWAYPQMLVILLAAIWARSARRAGLMVPVTSLRKRS